MDKWQEFGAEEVNIESFLNRYKSQFDQPLPIQNKRSLELFSSDTATVNNRRKALHRFLTDFPYDNHPTWGNTILSEIATKELLSSLWSDMLQEEGYTIHQSPTDIDKSWYNPGSRYQKGVDLVILDRNSNGILGIDVTLGNDHTVSSKRSHPGYQAHTAMPSIVLPISDIPIANSKTFVDFLNSDVYHEIRETGGLYSFRPNVWDQRTKHHISRAVLDGIYACHQSLWNTSYNRIGIIKNKLNNVERAIYDWFPPPEGTL